MNQQRFVFIVAAAAIVVTAVAWAFLPALQPAHRRVESQAIVHVEKARRLLDRFNADLAYRALLVDQLRDAEVDTDVSDPNALAENSGDTYQAVHEELWKSFEPADWADGKGRPARAGYGNLAGQIRDGVGARRTLIEENARLLDEALAETEAALSVSVGERSGREVAEAHRLKAVILFHQGMAARVDAGLKRGDSEPILRELAGYTRMAEALKGTQNPASITAAEDQIAAVRVWLAETETRVSEWRSEAAQLDGSIRAMEQRWADAQSRMFATRAEIEQLQDRGVDFSDPNGGKAFEQQLTSLDTDFRAAQRSAQESEAGALPDAVIDFTGDFLKGRYLENGQSKDFTFTHGLTYFKNQRSVLGMKIDSEEKGIAALREDLARLEAIKVSISQRQAEAGERLASITREAQTTYDELSRLQSEAEAVEERALRFLDQSAAAAQQAATSNDQWINDSREQLQNASPESKERSAFQSRTDDAWLGGFSAAQAADARAAKAWVYYDRFDAASRTAEVLASAAKAMSLAEIDAEAERAKADAAQQAGVTEVETAMGVLERAHRNAERHWTLAAQGAGLTYMMVLFGYQDYLADAVEAYRNAVKGRENDAFAANIVSRLRVLESR